MNPFTRQADRQVSAWGEVRLIRAIQEWLGDCSPPSPRGSGDDAAVWPLDTTAEGNLYLTTDALVYGRHFDDSASPRQAGHKLAHRNFSDIAAMGGRPRFLLLNLLSGADVSQSWIHEFILGLAGACRRVDCRVIGGDISGAEQGSFAALATVGGGGDRPLLRSSARAGDSLWVTGALGGSIRGRHLDFEARLEEGRFLAGRNHTHAVIDVTDGLAKDLPALLGDHLSVRLDRDTLPISRDAVELSRETGRSPEYHALADGEDYELLFSLDATEDPERFLTEWTSRFETPVTRIGHLEARPHEQAPLWIDARTGLPLEATEGGGFQHLRS